MLSRYGRERSGCGCAERVPVRSGAIRRFAMMLLVLSIALLFHPDQSLMAQAAPCLYALDASAQGAFSISGSTSISTSCSAVVESTGSEAFEMSGTEIFYMQNNAQVGVVGGSLLSGQTKIVNQSTGQTVQPVKISSPGDPLAFLPIPTSSTIIGKSHTSYDMNNKPPNNTLSPGIYCGGLTVGNTNGATFTMSPGTYIMAGGGLTLNSLAVVSGSGVTVYNTSSTGWGCSGSSSYTPITVSGQVTLNLSAPATGALAGVVLFGDRAGCSTVGSCQDQINGSSSTTLNGAMYFKSDTLLFSGSTGNGCMMAVADKININGNSSFAITGCTSTMGGVSVSVTPTTATLYGGQTQQFSATVTNASSTGVNWSITPSTTGTINSSGLYTAPASVTSQQTVTVTATSQAEPTVSASATITLMPKTTPTITWATPAAVTYGTALSATQLDATASVAGTFVYTPAAGTVLAAGAQTLSVTFTPTNTTEYNTATATVTLTVNKATSVITWATPAAITYGTALSAAQLDATASVAGTFVYAPAAGTVLAAGTQTLSVTFTPTNTTDYSTATATVTLTVTQTVPVITWAAPAAITYGTALSATQLDATASVAGTFVYTPAAGTVLAAGTQTLSVTFTPTNTTDYNTATATVSLTVNDATSVITWAAPAAITYGTALSATQLDATASVAGTFVYTPPAGTVLAAGTQTLSVTFTPTNTTDYTTATATVALTVNKATPVITWVAPPAITYGTALSATQLDAAASVAGTFVYTPAAGTVLAAGTQTLSLTFTPTNTTDYTTATATVSLTVNDVTSVITWAAPAAITYGTALSAAQLDATASVAGTFVYTPAAGTVLAAGTQTLSVTFTPTNTTDYNTATATVSLNVQSGVPPTISAAASPAPNANGWNNSTVTVTFTCVAGSYPIATCPSPVQVTTQGANQSICGHAVDTQGNSSAQACDTINLELTLPSITSSVSPTANSAGWNNTSVIVTFTCTASVSSISSCSPAQTVSSQGIGQVITGTVQDQAGSQATTSVTLNIDETPPAIVQFTAPSQLSPGQSGSATLTVSDIAPIASVVFSLNGTPVGTALAAPYSVNVTAPSTTTSGSTLTLTAVVTDVAGNSNSASKGIQVAASGVVVGEVLSDATGLPLAGANLQVIGQSGQSATSDSQGRYSIPVTSSQLFLSISQPGNSASGIPAMVTVERQVSVQSGVGTVPVDARMTAQAAPAVVAAGGGTVGTGAITLTVPAGGPTTTYYLTPLSQQGLPGLLPLGWSPVAAFDLQASPSSSASLSAVFTGLGAGTLYLVAYSYNVHAWSMVTPNLSASNSTLTVALPSTGDYALVVPDAGNASIQIPAAGQPLTGVPMVALPTTATSSGSLSPANIAPTGGTSTASLAVQSSTPLPSGTVIQSQVTETYTLTSGQLISEEPRYEDILLYQTPAPPTGSAVGASFPVTPSQTFQVSQLTSGDVHLNILSGRESVRGATGGSDPVAVTSGDATLTVAAGSLSQDTAIAVSPEPVDVFLPSTSTLVPLSEYNVDFSGQVLTNAAQLSVGTAGAAPGSNVVIVQEQRVAGVPYLVVVSVAQVTATNIVSQATPGLPGITQGGDYVFYELTVPTGFVSGTVSSGSGPVAAMVQTDALPFVAFSNSSGNYTVAAAAGTVNLTASIPNTALAGTTTVQVTAGQTASANITVAGQVEAATITPANGAVGVPLTAEIDITAADGINPATVTSSSVILTAAGSSTPVALRFVFSAGNSKLAVFPQAALQPSTQYTLQASGLANALGGLISVPTISFTTVAVTPPTYNTNALVFAMPDSNGNVAISAPAGSFPAGSTFLIVDQTNGVVLSLTVFNDGSVTGQMPATINDVLQITLTDPAGNVTTFTVSQFVAADGTTAVGPGGGTVTGPGGTGIIIPAGALPQGVTFKLTPLDQTAFPTLPTWQGLNFGSGLRITDPAMPTFKKEAKLAFPVPANAPSNAFYYVYRRLTDQNGNTYFETIDEAFVQGTGASAQVVTASPPFCGYHNSYGNFSIQADSPPLPVTAIDQDYFVMWDDAAQSGPSGIASPGLIVGLAQQTVPAVIGVSAATTEQAQGTVTITLTSNAANPAASQVAIYDGACATFTLFDPQLGGGSRSVTATQVNGTTTTLQATVDEVDGAQSDDGLYAIYAGLEDLYKNIGRVNFLFPAPTPPPPPPQVNIGIFNATTGQPVSGIVQSGTPLTLTFSSNLTVQSVSINGSQCNGIVCPSLMVAPPPANAVAGMNYYQLSSSYTPSNPGTYPITATAVDPISLSQATASQSILVIAAGGGNTSTITCTAAAPPPASPTAGCTVPQVVSVSPLNNASSVSTSVLPVVTFNEPVTNVSAGNVVLACAAQTGVNPSNNCSAGSVVPVLLVGVRAPSSPNYSQNPIADPVQPTDVITSLTISPLTGLQYNQTYNLTLNANSSGACVDGSGNPIAQKTNTTFIVDQNQPPSGPLCLQPYPPVGNPPYQFTTFGPQDLGGVTSQYEVLTRPVVIGNTAYAGEYLSSSLSGLGMFDITNPANPVDLGPGADFIGRAIDITGQAQSPVTGAGLVAISAGTAVDNEIPGNIWLYDVSSPTQPNRVGAVSVSSDVTSGIALRLFMKDQYLYASTFLQGLQVIDLGQAITEYNNVYNGANGNTPNPTQFGQAVSTAGDGFAMDTIVNTIPLPLTTGGGGQATMFDLKADSFAASGGGSQTLVVAAGELPFVMVDPTLSGSSAVLYPPSVGGSYSINPVQPLVMTSTDGTTNSLLCYGQALDIGTIAVTNNNGTTTSKHIAVVVGNGFVGPAPTTTSCPQTGQEPVLAVVDVSQAYTSGSPLTPQLIGLLPLTTGATDVTLSGTTALVSTGGNIVLVNLENPSQPALAGTITGNFGNWLAITGAGTVVSSSSGGTGNSIETATFQSMAIVRSVGPPVAQLDGTNAALNPTQITYQLVAPPPDVVGGTLTLLRNGQPVYTVNINNTTQGTYTQTIPAGIPFNIPSTQVSVSITGPDGSQTDPITLLVKSPDYPGLNQNVSTYGATAQFTNISPAIVQAGAGNTTIVITGTSMNSIQTAYVQDTLGNWNALSTTGNTTTQAQISIPAALLSSPGFLEVAPDENAQDGLALMVTSAGLPALANPPSLTNVSAYPQDIGEGGTAIISGGPFAAGSTVVIGRGTTAGYVLPTTLDSSTELLASLPGFISAQDLFLAVLSPDGSSLSAPIPVQSTFPYVESDTGPEDIADSASAPTSVEIDNVYGDLVWNPTGAVGTTPPSSTGSQSILLEGKGLTSGLTVTFQADQGTFTSTTAPTSTPPADPNNQIFQVSVPNQITDHPTFNWSLQLQRNSQPPIVSLPKNHQPQPQFTGIFGGRVHIIPYFDPISKTIVFKEEGFLRPGDAFSYPVSQAVQNVIWTFPINPVLEDGIPALQRETPVAQTTKDIYSGCTYVRTVNIPSSQVQTFNTNDLYIRTTHLSGLTFLQGQAFAVVPTSSGSVLASGTFNVRTYTGTLGTTWDKVINAAADEFGVPPQFLLAQAICESNFLAGYQNFRYEPVTIDMKLLASELPSTKNPNGSGRRIEGQNLSQYAIGGTIMDMPIGDTAVYTTPPADLNTPITLGPQFQLPGSPTSNSTYGPPVPIQAYAGLPGPGQPQPKVTVQVTDPPVTVNGVTQPPVVHPVTIVSNYPVWTKFGHHLNPNGSRSPTFFGNTTPASGLSGYQASINYVYQNGQSYINLITLGQQLTAGQTLTVTYNAMDSGNLYNVSGGSFTYDLTSGIASQAVLPQFKGLQFNPPQSLYNWFVSNFQSSDINYQYGNWLTGTGGERNIPFVGVPDPNNPGQTRPVAPVDGRFTGMTAQFFAGSSYGPVHMTAFNLDDSTHGADLMSVLGANPIFSVFKGPNAAVTSQNTQTGFELGATFTGANYSSQCPGTVGGATACPTSTWENAWAAAFRPYNSQGAHYTGSPSDIIKIGRSYEPH